MEFDDLIEDILSGDPDRRRNVIDCVFQFSFSAPENITEILLKAGALLCNFESLSCGKALEFFKELFDCFPAEKLDECSRNFIITQLLHAIAQDHFSIWELKHAYHLLNIISDKSLVENLIKNEESSIQILGSKLPEIGDFQAQNLLLKFLCRIAKFGNEVVWSAVWFKKEDIKTEFLKTFPACNPYECRKFLNYVNRKEKYSRVFSFVAQTVYINSIQVKKPSSFNITDFWIDLNFDSQSLSFCHEKLTDKDPQTVCIRAHLVEKYCLKSDQIQELSIIMNCPLSDYLLQDNPFSPIYSIKIKFWKFLNVNTFFEKLFGLPSSELDFMPGNNCSRKVSQSETLSVFDPQFMPDNCSRKVSQSETLSVSDSQNNATAGTVKHRKQSRSSEILSASFPTDWGRQTPREKVSDARHTFSVSDIKNAMETMETIARQRKISNSFDAIPYDSNVAKKLSTDSPPKKVPESSSFQSNDTPENKKSQENDRGSSHLNDSPPTLVDQENVTTEANELNKESKEDENRCDTDLNIVQEDESHPTSATLRQNNKSSPGNSKIVNILRSGDEALSQSKAKSTSKVLEIDKLVLDDSAANCQDSSSSHSNHSRRYAFKSFASSGRDSKHSHLKADHTKAKSPINLDNLVLNSKQTSGGKDPIREDDPESRLSPEIFLGEVNSKESGSGKKQKSGNGRLSQRRVRLFNADKSSPVHIKNSFENTSSNRLKSKKTPRSYKPVLTKNTSAQKDSSSESDFRPLHWKRFKRIKSVSNDSDLKEKSSASKSCSSSKKTKRIPSLSEEDEPNENNSHGENVRTETPTFTVFSPSNNDQENISISVINQVENSPKPHSPDWKDAQYSFGFCKDPKLSRTISQPLEEEPESERQKQLEEGLKILKERSNSSSSGRKSILSASKLKNPGKYQPKRNQPSRKTKILKGKRNSSKRNTIERVSTSSPDPYSVIDETEYLVEGPKEPFRKSKSFKDKRNSSNRNIIEKVSASSPDPYSVFDETEYPMEGPKQPLSVRISDMSRTSHRRLPSISEDRQSLDVIGGLTSIPNDPVSASMKTPASSPLKEGIHVPKPVIAKFGSQRIPTEKDQVFNNKSGRKAEECRRESDVNFADITSGPDDVFEEPLPRHHKSLLLSKDNGATNANVSESSVKQSNCEKINSDKTLHVSDLYNLQDIPVAVECSPLEKPRNPSETSNLSIQNVGSIKEKKRTENEAIEKYLQSLSEVSSFDEDKIPEWDCVERRSNENDAASNQAGNEEHNSSIIERASPMKMPLDKGKLNKKEELLRKSKPLKENLENLTKSPETQKTSKKRKYEENYGNPNIQVDNIESPRDLLHRALKTLQKSLNGSKDQMSAIYSESSQRDSSKKRQKKDSLDRQGIERFAEAHRQMEEPVKSQSPLFPESFRSDSSKREKKDPIDYKEIKRLQEKYYQMEESREREAEHLKRIEKSKIEKQKEKQKKETFTSTLSPYQGSTMICDNCNRSASTTKSPSFMWNKFSEKYKTSTPKPGRDLAFLKPQLPRSLICFQGSLEHLNARVFTTLKKYYLDFTMKLATSRQALVSCINYFVENNDFSEDDLEYLHENIRRRRNHILNSVNKIMKMAEEYFENERKWIRKYKRFQEKVIGKYSIELRLAQDSILNLTENQIVLDTQKRLKSLLNDFKYY